MRKDYISFLMLIIIFMFVVMWQYNNNRVEDRTIKNPIKSFQIIIQYDSSMDVPYKLLCCDAVGGYSVVTFRDRECAEEYIGLLLEEQKRVVHIITSKGKL